MVNIEVQICAAINQVCLTQRDGVRQKHFKSQISVHSKSKRKKFLYVFFLSEVKMCEYVVSVTTITTVLIS